MVVCPNCQKEVDQGANFCDSCGYNLTQVPPIAPDQQTPPYQAPQPYPYQQEPPPVYLVPIKNPGVAVILALLLGLFGLNGIGHIYVGQIMKGILLLVLGFVLYGLLVATAFLGLFTFGWAWVLTAVLGIIVFIYWIWQAFDAYKAANQYNAAVLQTGRAPW